MKIFACAASAVTRAVLLILFITTFTQQTFATHLAGGEIEYRNIGVRKWNVRLTVYRYCDNGAAWICSSTNCTQTMTATPSPQLSAGGLNPNGCNANPNAVNFTLSFQSVTDVGKDNIARCGAQAKNTCDNLGGVTPGPNKPSIEKYVFEGTLDLSHPSLNSVNTCAYWDIGWNYCCRNSTVNVQGQPSFHIQSTINIFDGQTNLSNNSPVFKNEASNVFCGGQEYVYNVGAMDPDRDSLTYRVCKALQAANTPVPYNTPYNESRPFPLNATLPPHNAYPGQPFVIIDSTNGDISLNANNTTTQPIGGSLVVEMIQWRYKEISGVKVPYISGITTRDLQIYSMPCLGNNPPTLSTNPALPNGKPKTNWDVCAGQKICFTITANDTDYKPNSNPPRIDSTFLSWDSSIVRPGKISFEPDYIAGARSREDRWKFCWQTELSDTSSLPYYFTVKAMDNMCPNPGKVTRAFSIKIGRAVQADLVKQSLACGKWGLSVRKTNVSQSFSSAMLEIANQPDDYDFIAGKKTIYSTNPNPSGTGSAPRVVIKDSIQFNKPGKYYVRYTITSASTACPSVFYDSIEVNTSSWVNVSVNDTFKCRAGSMDLSAMATGGTLPYTYKWYRNSTALPPLNTQPGNNVFAATDTISARYFIQVSDSNNCTAWDTMNISVKRISQNPILVNDSSQCIGLNSFAFSYAAVAGFSNYTIKWVSEQSGSNDSVWKKTYSTPGTKLVKLVVSEAAGCTDTVSRAVNVWSIPSVANIIKVNDSIQCVKGNQFKFSYTRLPELSYKWSYNDTLGTDSILTRIYSETGVKSVRLIVGDSGCSDTATRTVLVTDVPQAGRSIIVDDSLQCVNGNAFKFSYLRTLGLTYTWLHDFNMTPDSVLKKSYTTAGTKTVKLIVSREGCSDTASQDVKVTSKPVVTNVISVNKNTQCVSNNNFVFTRSNTNDSNVFTHGWFNGDSLVYAPSIHVSYTTTGLKKIRLVITQPGACTDTASMQIAVTSVPVAAGTIKVNDSIQCINSNQFKLSYSKTAGPYYKWFYNNTTSTDSVILLNYTTTGLRSVRLMVGEPGCSDTTTQTLLVTDAPVANNDIIVNNAAQCVKGNKFRLSYAKKPFVDYKWIYNNTTSKDSVIFLSYSDTGSKTIKLMLGEPGCSDTAIQQITIWPQPVTRNVLSVNDTVQCLTGNSFILTYNVANNPYHYTNTWLYGTLTSPNNQVSISYPDAGNKQVKLVLATINGCIDTMVKNLTVKPSPQPLIQGQQAGLLVNNEYNYSVVAQAGNRYKWNVVNGSFISADTVPTVRVKWTAVGQGILSVQQDLDGCKAKDSITVTVGSTGLNELSDVRSFRMIPNPSNGRFVIQLESEIAQQVQVKINNTFGAVVLNQAQQLDKGMNQVDIYTDVAPGVYFLSISNGSSEVVRKIVISK